MKEYDLIFSLGFACGCSQALRAAGLQYASYPLDWTGSYDLGTSVSVIVSDFSDWLDEESLKLVDVLHGPGFGTRAYLNEKTQIGFCHEFPDTKPFVASYSGVKATYERRIERMQKRLQLSKRILAAYVEHAYRPKQPDAELASQLNRLRAKYPDAQFDLIYVYEEIGCARPSIRSRENGLMVVAADYRKLENGKPTQYIDVPPLAKFFNEHLSISRDSQSSDRTRVMADMKIVHSLRWGPDKSIFRRWINQRAYKLYRHLERILQRRGLIHAELPLYFWDHT